MFPTGLTEVMVTPLEPPRVGPLLAPDLVLGLALPEVLRLLDLPTCAPFPTGGVRCPRIVRGPRRQTRGRIAENGGMRPRAR
jgi:hypothetical protein